MGIAQSYQTSQPIFPLGMNYNIEQTVTYILQNSFLNDEYIKLTLNGDCYEARKSDLKDKIIFNNCANVKNLLPILRLSNPVLTSTIQATVPEKLLFTFLQTEEGRIFKRQSDFLTSGNTLKNVSSTNYIQPQTSQPYTLARSNSNYIGCYTNSNDNATQAQPNILNEITNSQNNQSGMKTLTRNNSVSNAKSVAQIPVSILKNKGQTLNHPVISSSPMIKITPLGTTTNPTNYLGGTTTITTIHQINNSNRSVTPTRAPQPTYLSEQQYTPSNRQTVSKTPYINFQAQHDNNQPSTPIGKSMFDLPKEDQQNQYQVPKTPTQTQTGILNSIIGGSNILSNNNRLSMTPVNQVNCSNISGTSAIKPSLVSQTLTNNQNLNSVIGQYNPSNTVERVRSMTPLPYSSSQQNNNNILISTNSNNVLQIQPTTPSNYSQNVFDQNTQNQNNFSTPNSNSSKTNFFNFNNTATINQLMHQGQSNQQNNSLTRSNSSYNVNGLGNTPNQSSSLAMLGNTPNQNNNQAHLNTNYNFTSAVSNASGIQTLPQNLKNTGSNINIGQLLSQRSVTPPPVLRSNSSIQQIVSGVNSIQAPKPYLETTNQKEIQESINQSVNKTNTPSNQTQISLSNNQLINSNNQNNSQAHFSSLIVQNNPSCSSLALGSILQSTSTNIVANKNSINGSIIQPQIHTNQNLLQPSYQIPQNEAQSSIPYESVRNKFQQLRKMTGVRKTNELSHSPLNQKTNEQETNSQSNFNFSQQLANSQKKFSAQKSKSISNLHLNNLYGQEAQNQDVQRNISEIPYQFLNPDNREKSKDNYSKNILDSSGKKTLTKNYSCNNIYSQQKDSSQNDQQQQKPTQIPYYLGRTLVHSNKGQKDLSNLPSLSNISQILYTQEDQSRSNINGGGNPAFKIQNAFLPGLSPIQKSNQGVDNSRSFACEALPLVGNNNLFNNQMISQGEQQEKTPKVFKFNNSNACTTPINEIELYQKQEQEIKEKAKEQVNEIIQRTVVREFENLKQITEIVTQNTLQEKQRIYQEFVQKDDQNQLLQSIKNSELVNQTINEIQNCIRQNTLESVRSQNNNQTPIYQQSVQLNSQERISTLPSRQPAVVYKNNVMNSFQTQQSVNNIFTQNGQEIVSTNLNMPTYNSNRSNRFNNSQQEEDDNGIKKTCSINFGYNPQNVNESIADNKNTQARNSQDSNESPCSSSLKISEINKPAGQEQINYGIKIFQAGGSIASTFNDLNSFAYKNLESQRQNLVMTNSSLQDNFIYSARQNGNNSNQMKIINGIKQGLNTQIQSTQASNIENSTPKNQNQLDSYQLNTLSYSGTNGDITIKKQNNNNNQSIQTDIQQKSYSYQYPNNFNQEAEKVQSSQSHFPIQKIHFNKNSISSQRNATPNSKRESIYSNGEMQQQQQQQQQQVEYQVTPTNKQSYNHSYKQSNSFKELFENNNNQMNIQNEYQYVASTDDNQQIEQRKRNSSCYNSSQNEIYQSKGYSLNPNEKQRQISIMSELSVTNSTPQKLINTATKQKMMDEIERQKNNRQGSIQAVSQKEIENIRSNMTEYWNNTCNQLTNQTQDKRGGNNQSSYAFEAQQQYSYVQTPTSQNLKLDAFAGEPIPTDSTPQNKFYETAPSIYQNQIKIQNSYQNPFKMSQQSMNNFEIKSNIHFLQTPDPNAQHLTKHFNQSQENNAAFSKPPLQNSGLLKSQRQNIQKQSIQKQGSIQFTDQSPPINNVEPYKNRQLYYQSSNNSSLSQVGSSQNRLSPQIEQQLINSSQEYRLNLKNSRPNNQNTPGQSYQSMKMQQQKLLSSLNPQQLKSYQNSIENYNYAINGKQLFSEQIPQQNSHRKSFDMQQQYNQNQEDEMNRYITLEDRELTEGIQEEDENEMQNEQNIYVQQSGAKQQQYMTQEQLMILEQHQIQQQQQQQQQQQEEYYDDLDSDNLEEEDEENPDEISYQQQNQIQNDGLDEYGEQNCENMEEQLTQQDEQYYENNMQGDGYGQQYQNNLQYQDQIQDQNQEDYELNEQMYVQQQQQNLQLQQQQNYNMQDPALFNPDQYQIQQYNISEQYGNSVRESMQNNSLRSSKQSIGIPARRFEENLSSVKKKKSGLYNQKINFEGDNNFKLTDQPLSVDNMYQSDGFQQIRQKQQYPIQQYQSLQINDQARIKSQLQAQYQNKLPQNLNNQFDQNNQNPYFQEQYKYFLQQGNELVDEVADDQSSLSQISQSPLRPSQLQLENQEQQQVYEEGDQNNIYQQDENIYQNNLYQYNNEEQQMLSHRSCDNNNNYQINIYANQNEGGDQIIQNKNYVYNNNYNIPQTENISVNALLQMNKRSAIIEDHASQRAEAGQVNLFKQPSYQNQQNAEQQLELYSQPTNKNEFQNFNDQQEQIYAQQFKGQTQMTQEESFYENRILADINLESGRKENHQLSNGKRGTDYEMNSQENLSYREGSQRQNSSRYVASAENVKKKNISRRIFNKSARYYNEGNHGDQKKNLQEFEADQKKKKVRTSLQNFVEELNEISGRSARGLLDLSHRIQQSNSFILDRSNLNEKSFYQNEKSFQQNEKIFSNNNIQNQSDGDENSIMQNTMLTGGPNSNRKEYTNARDYEQRLSEYVICHKDQNEDEVLEEKKNENLLKSPQVDQNDYQSNTVFNTNNQSNSSYAPQTSVFQTGIQQQSSARLSHVQNNNDKNQYQSLSNDSPFVITTNERRRSNEQVDEISIRFNEQPAFSHASFNQEQMQQIQQQKQELELKQSLQIEKSNSSNNQQLDQQSEKKNQETKNEEQSSKKLQDSPFIEDRRKSEKQSSQYDHVQLASFAHSDNFISIQQVPSSSISNLSSQPISNQQPVQTLIPNQNQFNSETDMKQVQQNENQDSNSPLKKPQQDQNNQNSFEQNKSTESIDSQKDDLQASKSENQTDLTASKKSQGVSRQRPISEIPTESKFVKQRQPHFENTQNKDTHARSQSNHIKKKKHFELSIDACNEVQKSHNQENKETPQFSEHGISSKSSSLFKSSKPVIPNKRQQIISFLDYQKTMKKSQD
ncbi:hypothetical protein TTHERM_00716180 (macronuclear) [Tetrahymena thermophila SB210]|uniref:Uncharacterized protein n=1 Tax=Tetrahymena thermophila (strain SB210) TaxID=312017 RepID=I7MCM7_TETTS|nr:hypothetical protein TTHERM_00716180 [Tetrahymena thermophila SB210]EAR84312.2 hypothetical protein TTHERM_00716180 [Tetrahymena thermophila SB210]|eukprot:XP_001031975.2 hypothetical protein TTHERM_00716180 [Tetrahymena thermophila SB210]